MENDRADGADAAGDKLSSHLAMAGHLCSDINQGALSAVLPFLVVARGFSYAAVAMLVFLFPAVECAVVLLCFSRRFMALGTSVKAGGWARHRRVTDYL